MTARAMSFLQILIIRSLVFVRSFRRCLLRGNPHCLLRGCSESLKASIYHNRHALGKSHLTDNPSLLPS